MTLLDTVLDLFFPTKCVFCHKLTQTGETVCKACAKNLPFVSKELQQQSFPHIPVCVSPLFYEGVVRESLLRYKFSGASCYAKTYGDFLRKCIDENGISCDIITWVPLSRLRLRKRGYDQARLLAQELAIRSGIPCLRLLKKTRNTSAQSLAGGAANRKQNISRAYAALDQKSIKGKKILLVDDIVTTGSTLAECARILSGAGASSVSAVTLARHRP